MSCSATHESCKSRSAPATDAALVPRLPAAGARAQQADAVSASRPSGWEEKSPLPRNLAPAADGPCPENRSDRDRDYSQGAPIQT